MEYMDCIKLRRSIRKFKNDEISKEIVEDLINCARISPSAKNKQPWLFVVVKGAIKDKIADMMIEYVNKPEIDITSKEYKHLATVTATANTMKEAPILILVLKIRQDEWYSNNLLSIGSAIEHICLRATDLGLGSLWINNTIYIEKEIANFVNYQDMEVVSAISIGYPNENPIARPRKELNEILNWYN